MFSSSEAFNRVISSDIMLGLLLADARRALTAGRIFAFARPSRASHFTLGKFTNTWIAPCFAATPRLPKMVLMLTPPCCCQRRSEACSHWLIFAEANGCMHIFQPQIQNFTYSRRHKFAYLSSRYGRYDLHSRPQRHCVCGDKSPHVTDTRT